MAKKNTKRKIIGLVSEITGDRIYYTRKNTQNTPEKLSLRKYNPKRLKNLLVETKLNHEKVNKLHRLVLFILVAIIYNKPIVCIFCYTKM